MSDKIRHKEKNMDMHDIQGGEKKVMTKFNKKMINVFATAALVAGVAAPVAAITAPTAIQAAGNGTISATNSPTVSDNGIRSFGSVRFTIPEGTTLKKGDEVVIGLPYDLPENGTEIDNEEVNVTEDTYNTVGSKTYIFGSFSNNTGAKNSVTLNNNGVVLGELEDYPTISGLFSAHVTKSDRITVTYNGPDAEVNKEAAIFTLRAGALIVDENESGAKEVEFTAPPSSTFPAGKTVIGNVNDSGDLNLSFKSLDTSNNKFTPTIVLEEPTAGTFKSGTEVKIKLPNGYNWTNLRGNVDRIYGNADGPGSVTVGSGSDSKTYSYRGLTFKKEDSGRELVIGFHEDAKVSTTATKFEIPFDFEVDDSSSLKAGDITARISGKTGTNVTSAKIGTYGDFGTGQTATDAPTLTAGKSEQEIADITLKENIGESLINNRTVELTLPEGAAWQSVFEAVYEDAANPDYRNLAAPGGHETIKNEDVTLDFVGYTGTDRRTAKYNVISKGDDSAELEFEDLEVALASDFTGDLKVTFGGTSGVTGDVLVAKVVAPLTATAATKPNVKIGATNQAAAEFTLTEGQAGAMEDDGRVVLDLPYGVYFNGTPTVAVSSGDAVISNVRTSGDRNQLWFTIDSESDTASTIKVSGVNLELDRTVPEGDVVLEVRGSAVSETEVYTRWANNKPVASVAIANTATPAPADQSAVETVFTLGSTSYSVNGESRTADVAPYSENGRTYLPVRYVADALGVTPQNILFDKATSTVTLLKGDRVVQIKLNTNQLIVNGSVIAMDVKAVTKDNRTVLPIRWVGQALGADVSYDETAKTITVK